MGRKEGGAGEMWLYASTATLGKKTLLRNSNHWCPQELGASPLGEKKKEKKRIVLQHTGNLSSDTRSKKKVAEEEGLEGSAGQAAT